MRSNFQATWNSNINRSQISQGAEIMGQVVPIVIHLMMNNKKGPDTIINRSLIGPENVSGPFLLTPGRFHLFSNAHCGDVRRSQDLSRGSTRVNEM